MITDPTPIRRCVCFDTTFAELQLAEITSVEEASERFGCGTNCGTCVPYIQKMIDSGRTAFGLDEIVPTREGERLGTGS